MRRSQCNPWPVLGQHAWADTLATVLGLTDGPAARRAVARCLLAASVLRASLSAVASRVAGLGRETIRKSVHADLPGDLGTLERRLAAGLRHRLPRAFRRRPIPVAIDTHARPFYGDREGTPGVVGGKPKDGAKWVWTYATAVSLVPGRRHTLALTAVRPKDTPDAVAERLLAQLGWAGVRVRYVLLDRGFYSAPVVNALTRRKLRFIIPMVRRGEAAERFFRRGTRGWFEHTIRNRRSRAEPAAVRVAVVPGHDGRRPLVFACSPGFERLPRVVLEYRTRFGIETSYRQLGECLARTTAADPVYRLLLVGISLLIRAWWVEAGGVTLTTIRWSLIVILTPAPATDGTTPRPAQTQHAHTQQATP
jgi:putative transposase